MSDEEIFRKKLDRLNENSTYGMADIKALRQEIESLKKKNELLKEDTQHKLKEMMFLYNIMKDRLEQENEQLKKENAELKEEIKQLRDKFFLF